MTPAEPHAVLALPSNSPARPPGATRAPVEPPGRSMPMSLPGANTSLRAAGDFGETT